MSEIALPQHIALVLDGNRRWAKQHKLKVIQGHTFVLDNVIQPLVEHCIQRQIPYITMWAFSTENWKREPSEVDHLLNLFRQVFQRNASELHEKGVKVKTIGDLSRFPKDIQEKVAEWTEKTQHNSKITVIFALNYGGRDEILRAVNKAVAEKPGQPLTQTDIEAHLDTFGIPDPDLIVRPGGEKRLSGFFSWQNAYSELYFTELLMPDFTPAELDKALAEFAQRQRRFGS